VAVFAVLSDRRPMRGVEMKAGEAAMAQMQLLLR
jgi:hypothetical protein